MLDSNSVPAHQGLWGGAETVLVSVLELIHLQRLPEGRNWNSLCPRWEGVCVFDLGRSAAMTVISSKYLLKRSDCIIPLLQPTLDQQMGCVCGVPCVLLRLWIPERKRRNLVKVA